MADPPASKLRTKRLLLKKPAWASASSHTQTNDDPTALFSRPSETYEEIIAEKERHRRERHGRKELQVKKIVDTEEREGKRRRLGPEDHHEFTIALQESRVRGGTERSGTSTSEVTLTVGTPTKRDSETSKPGASTAWRGNAKESSPVACEEFSKSPKASLPNEPIIIAIDSSDHDRTPPRWSPKGQSAAVPSIPTKSDDIDPEESDEEFRNLVARARDRRRMHELGAARGHPAFAPAGARAGSSTSPCLHQQASPPPSEEIISILITSRIDGTGPLVIKRRLSQRLREVRLAYCDRWQLDEAISKRAFLTWRNRKLFDVTSCTSLGVSVDELGELMIRTQGNDSAGLCEGGIHLELVTPEMLEENKKSQANNYSSTPAVAPEEEGPTAESQAQSQDRTRMINIVLKAKDYEEFRLTVRHTTTFKQIASAFRKKRGIMREITLRFDGDPLRPDDEVQNSEISDMDHIDVYVK